MSEPHRKASKRQNWRTPKWLFYGIQDWYGARFQLDAAADANNALCDMYYDGTPGRDALKMDWLLYNWCNPPFDRTAEFIKKALTEAEKGSRTVMLLTASTENKYWLPMLRSGPRNAVEFITGRIPFIDPDTLKPVTNNVTGSALFVINPPSRTDQRSASTPQVYWTHRDEFKRRGLAYMEKHNISP